MYGKQDAAGRQWRAANAASGSVKAACIERRGDAESIR
jgi:hypothetical protein